MRSSAFRNVNVIKHCSQSSFLEVGTPGAANSSTGQKHCSNVSIDGQDMTDYDVKGEAAHPDGVIYPIITQPRWVSIVDGNPTLCSSVISIRKIYGYESPPRSI